MRKLLLEGNLAGSLGAGKIERDAESQEDKGAEEAHR